jgi:hypothetical protein
MSRKTRVTDAYRTDRFVSVLQRPAISRENMSEG